MNRNIVEMIRKYIGENHNDWDHYLPELSYAMRTSVCDSTGVTPAELFLGRKIMTPFEQLTGIVNPEAQRPTVAKVKKLSEETMRKIVKAQQKQAEYYDKFRREGNIKVGDSVLHKTFPQSSSSQQLVAKFMPLFEGPFLVTKVFKNNVTLKKRDGSCINTHIEHVKLYHARNIHTIIAPKSFGTPRFSDQRSSDTQLVCSPVPPFANAEVVHESRKRPCVSDLDSQPVHKRGKKPSVSKQVVPYEIPTISASVHQDSSVSAPQPCVSDESVVHHSVIPPSSNAIVPSTSVGVSREPCVKSIRGKRQTPSISSTSSICAPGTKRLRGERPWKLRSGDPKARLRPSTWPRRKSIRQPSVPAKAYSRPSVPELPAPTEPTITFPDEDPVDSPPPIRVPPKPPSSCSSDDIPLAQLLPGGKRTKQRVEPYKKIKTMMFYRSRNA